jgi:phage terminase large subunit
LVVDTNSYIICDSSEPKSIRELRIEEINVIPAVKGQDSIINGINKLKSKNIHIHRDSFNIKKEIRGYKFKKEKDGNTLNVPIKCPDHSLDAIRYAATRFDI